MQDGNEPPSYVRGGKFLDQQSDRKFLKKELCCVGHVICVCGWNVEFWEEFKACFLIAQT